MSFFGNSNRPDLKVGSDLGEHGVSDARYLGEVGAPEADIATPAFATDRLQQSGSAPTPPERCSNIVATGAKWKGTLKLDDSVRIDGTFAGEIDTKGTVHVSEGADVDAKVHATFVIISGSFKGEIRCDQRVEMMPRGKVSGEITTKALNIHEGAILDGNVQMTETGSSRLSTTRGSSRSSASNGNGSHAATETEEAPAEKRNGRTAEASVAE